MLLPLIVGGAVVGLYMLNKDGGTGGGSDIANPGAKEDANSAADTGQVNTDENAVTDAREAQPLAPEAPAAPSRSIPGTSGKSSSSTTMVGSTPITVQVDEDGTINVGSGSPVIDELDYQDLIRRYSNAAFGA